MPSCKQEASLHGHVWPQDHPEEKWEVKRRCQWTCYWFTCTKRNIKLKVIFRIRVKLKSVWCKNNDFKASYMNKLLSVIRILKIFSSNENTSDGGSNPQTFYWSEPWQKWGPKNEQLYRKWKIIFKMLLISRLELILQDPCMLSVHQSTKF